MSKKALIVWAEGMEEIEAITPVDLLRRAAVEVIVAGLNALTVKGSRGVLFQADILLEKVPEDVDLLIFPGGHEGATNLSRSAKVKELILKQHAKKKWIAAICASPALVLSPTGVLSKKKASCYPGYEKYFEKDVQHSQEPVMIDGNIITSRGPGTAYPFSLTLIECLLGKSTAEAIAKATLFKNR